ncbi:glycosyltransferase [Methylomonas sp. AM2-LC]|uniref:glycosyltransferase n=1 Tax=Methylomonas sp. AM2-LC TaxID=3153301 RepID=UPI003263B84B
MIVKNEASIICRCLQSAMPLLDYVLIVDTGSSDATPQIIRDFLHTQQLPGCVIEEPWQNFAYNRNFALQKLREHPEIDYGLMIDADEVLVFEADFNAEQFKQQLQLDLYDVQTRYGNIAYLRPQLFSNRLALSYKGVLHEFLDIRKIPTRGTAQGFFNHPIQDSTRNHNPNKFADDAALLEQVLREEKDAFMISRYTFYLAQSYRDCGAHQQAMDAYLRRAELGGWIEEVYFSLLSAARLKEVLDYASQEVIQSYLAAHELLPARLEALHGAIRYCRLHEKYQQAYILAKQAITQSAPKDGLFLENWIFDYGLLDELSIVAYWVGNFQECFDCCLSILQQAKIPTASRQRIRDNACLAISKLGQADLANLLPP